MDQKDLAIAKVIETRLGAMDKALELTQSWRDKMPTFIAEQVSALRTLNEERFTAIAMQFKERDMRSEQLAAAGAVAINAALQAAKESVASQNFANKEAIAKSDTTTTKLLDNLDGKITDMKSQISRIENTSIGRASAGESQQSNFSLWVSMAAVVVALLSVFMNRPTRGTGTYSRRGGPE